MATITIPDEKKTLTQDAEVRDYLAGIGIAYERWEPSLNFPPALPPPKSSPRTLPKLNA